MLHFVMTDTAIDIVEYLTEDGRSPFREWLLGLRDREARVRVRVRIDRISLGNFGDSHGVGGGVSEVRISHGPGYRVYFGRRGNTVVIIEHNLDVIKRADYIVDLGPEGGQKGGRIVAAGTPEEVTLVKGSETGVYLQEYVRS